MGAWNPCSEMRLLLSRMMDELAAPHTTIAASAGSTLAHVSPGASSAAPLRADGAREEPIDARAGEVSSRALGGPPIRSRRCLAQCPMCLSLLYSHATGVCLVV
jgi:hypothetical protein